MPDPEVLDTEHVPHTGALVRRAPRDVVLMPVIDVKLAKQRLEELQEFCANYLTESKDGGQDGGDYGVIPGAGKKRVLFKSGGEKLTDVYGLAPRYVIISKVEDWDHGLFDYALQCELYRKTDEMFVGSGLGSCSSWESKYRWRDAKRVCPQCSQETIIKGKEEYGGGWVCWKSKGGCGAKFADNDPAIIDQKLGRVENPDLVDTKNTVLKMAKKRAFLDAVIAVTRSSGIFTQDLEEHVSDYSEPVGQVSTTTAPPQPAESAEPAAQPSGAIQPGSPKQPNETQQQYVARVKREAEAKKATAGGSQAASAPAQAAPAATPAPPPATVTKAAPAPPAPAPESADGRVQITGINVRNGPMVVKDGKTVPSWGPLYVIAFSHKVKANDGVAVADATTFDEKIAKQAEDARDAKQADPTQGFVKPVVEAGKKKGSYNLVKFE